MLTAPVRQAYLPYMDVLTRDLRIAIRALRRKPGVTALAALSLALATGFSTAAFSVLDAWSLRDLPVRAPAELAWIYANTREHRPDNFTWIEYQALASRSRQVTSIVAQDRESFRIKLPGRDDFPITCNVSDNSANRGSPSARIHRRSARRRRGPLRPHPNLLRRAAGRQSE